MQSSGQRLTRHWHSPISGWPTTDTRRFRTKRTSSGGPRQLPRRSRRLTHHPMATEIISNAGLPSVELLLPATWNRLDLAPATRLTSIARLVERTTKAGPEFAEARTTMRAEFERAAEIGAASGASLAFRSEERRVGKEGRGGWVACS